MLTIFRSLFSSQKKENERPDEKKKVNVLRKDSDSVGEMQELSPEAQNIFEFHNEKIKVLDQQLDDFQDFLKEINEKSRALSLKIDEYKKLETVPDQKKKEEEIFSDSEEISGLIKSQGAYSISIDYRLRELQKNEEKLKKWLSVNLSSPSLSQTKKCYDEIAKVVADGIEEYQGFEKDMLLAKELYDVILMRIGLVCFCDSRLDDSSDDSPGDVPEITGIESIPLKGRRVSI